MRKLTARQRKQGNRILRATRLKQEAEILLALQSYPDALTLLKEAHPLFDRMRDKAKCAVCMAYCNKKLRGISDFRSLGCGIWYAGKRITPSEMHKLLSTKMIDLRERAYSGVGGTSRRRTGITIKDVVFAALEAHEDEDDVTLEGVLPQVLEANPASVFDERHLKFYKSKYRTQKKKEK